MTSYRAYQKLTQGGKCGYVRSDIDLCCIEIEPAEPDIKHRVSRFIRLKVGTEGIFRYIQRFRNPQKLQSEAGYYLSSLVILALLPDAFARDLLAV